MEYTQPIKKIVLVDDDAITNMINTKIITREFNLEVTAYAHAPDAIRHLATLILSQEDMPDIILLDINMPVMDGWEFLDAFQKLPGNPTHPCSIFMLSSSIDLEDIEKSKSYAAVKDFISKPLTTEKFRTILKATNLSPDHSQNAQ